GAGQMTLAAVGDNSTTTQTFDAAGQMTGLRHRASSGTQIDLSLLAYDAVGNPTLKVTRDGRHTMSYDAANQLLSEYHPLAGAKTWTFDEVGNRLSQDHTQVGTRTLTNWVYDAADQLVTETTGTDVTTFTFDGAGNQQVEQ